jgi:hypothetical protein
MRLSHRMTAVVAALIVGIGLLATYGYSQYDKGDKPAPGGAGGAPAGMPQMSPEQQKEMEAMMKAGTPGPEHKKIADEFAGTWDCTVTMWMEGNPQPMTSNGTMKSEMMFGGRYLHMGFKGDFMGQPFEGGGVMGYDNITKKYFGTWMDNMSTCMMHSTGTWDAASKAYNFNSEMPDPMTGKMVKVREVVTVTDNNHHTHQMYAPDKSGKEMKCMEIKYTRKM